MASKRPNKQQRQRQNRQRREARQARSVHAGEATAIARGEREKAEPTANTRTSAKGKGSKAQARADRKSRYSIPGQRAVVMAFLFTIVSAATLLIAPVQVQREVPIDDPVLEEIDEDDQEVDEDAGTVTYVDDAKLLDEEGPAVAAGVMLTPILITGAAVWFTKKPQRSTAWTMAMIALAAYIFLFAGPYGIITLPSMIALAVGGFQSRRAESKERLAEIRAKKAAAGDGEVIDVEATEVTEDESNEPETETDTGIEATEGELAEPVADDDRR
ncbi:hypothetical protein NHL50_07850 [Acidimicrobiia bacterium EGI L10123]|uniref:hypothetical protein n=1 Tax=Salinilacustrithrix flava TaxID=2957203 RepID=UPI003D7C191B|nr:hypothetical protein [Acidimicrobiia bacterium EGI L10123]